MIAAFTMNYLAEAAGIAVAAATTGRPYVLSFTVETDGRLPSGESLGQAIETIDELARGVPEYYMINCAHPSHFAHVLAELGPLAGRIGGVRANASRLSHAELDACTTLDDGDPAELGADYRRLRTLLPNLAVVGGCCGTDHRHVAAIAAALRPIASAA
jgi:homocysteine S-methyltransferase